MGVLLSCRGGRQVRGRAVQGSRGRLQAVSKVREIGGWDDELMKYIAGVTVSFGIHRVKPVVLTANGVDKLLKLCGFPGFFKAPGCAVAARMRFPALRTLAENVRGRRFLP